MNDREHDGVLAGKVAIVTGAGRGIGRAIAIEYAREGAKVVVASRTRSTVDEVVAEIRAAGGTALGVTCELGDPDQITAMVASTVAEFGTVDILVNNARTYGTKDAPSRVPVDRNLEDFPEDEWDWMFETGVKATLRAMQAVFPHMKQHGGKIINFGSRKGITGHEYAAAYNACKEAIRALSRTAAREWGRYGINVNVINPALQTTAMAGAHTAPGVAERQIANTAMGRLGVPHDGARVAVFLAGPDSDFVTGMTFFVDGGLTIQP